MLKVTENVGLPLSSGKKAETLNTKKKMYRIAFVEGRV
jgi:hypothetical protein